MSALHLIEGWLKVRGNGDRERVVPMREPEFAARQAYLGEPRTILLRKHKASPHVFISNRGVPMTRQGFWKLLKEYAQKVGLTKPVSPCTTASPRICWRVGPVF